MAVASKLPSISATFRSAANIAPYRFVTPVAGSAIDVADDSQAFFAQISGLDGESVVGVTGIKGIAAGTAQEVFIGGIVLVEAGGNVSNGETVSSDASGRAVADGEVFCAVAVTGGTEGSVIAVKLK